MFGELAGLRQGRIVPQILAAHRDRLDAGGNPLQQRRFTATVLANQKGHSRRKGDRVQRSHHLQGERIRFVIPRVFNQPHRCEEFHVNSFGYPVLRQEYAGRPFRDEPRIAPAAEQQIRLPHGGMIRTSHAPVVLTEASKHRSLPWYGRCVPLLTFGSKLTRTGNAYTRRKEDLCQMKPLRQP